MTKQTDRGLVYRYCNRLKGLFPILQNNGTKMASFLSYPYVIFNPRFLLKTRLVSLDMRSTFDWNHVINGPNNACFKRVQLSLCAN